MRWVGNKVCKNNTLPWSWKQGPELKRHNIFAFSTVNLPTVEINKKKDYYPLHWQGTFKWVTQTQSWPLVNSLLQLVSSFAQCSYIRSNFCLKTKTWPSSLYQPVSPEGLCVICCTCIREDSYLHQVMIPNFQISVSVTLPKCQGHAAHIPRWPTFSYSETQIFLKKRSFKLSLVTQLVWSSEIKQMIYITKHGKPKTFYSLSF